MSLLIQMYVCTLLSRVAISDDFVSKLLGLLKSHDINIIGNIQSLNDLGTVKEIKIGTYTVKLANAMYQLSDDESVDIVVQNDSASKRKRLVVFDMDSTLIQNEVIDLIAAHAGVEAEVSKVTEAAMRGEIDFTESLAQRVALLKGVPVDVYDELKKEIQLTRGAEDLCHNLRDQGVKTAVLSGGFLPLALWIKDLLKLDYAFANVLEDDGFKLTGKTVGRVVNDTVKAELLKEIAQKENIPLEYTIAVGDGSNDLKMMAEAGFGVAFSAKPLVQKHAPSRLNTGNLADILYLIS